MFCWFNDPVVGNNDVDITPALLPTLSAEVRSRTRPAQRSAELLSSRRGT
jgi:hypothetical protein